MADLVLGLGQHRHLVAKARGPGDPVPLGQATHQFRIGVHLDEGEHGLSVRAGHVVIHLDDPTVVQEGLEVIHGRPRAPHHATSSGAPFMPGRLATIVSTS